MKTGAKYSWRYTSWGKAEGKSTPDSQEYCKHDTQIKVSIETMVTRCF